MIRLDPKVFSREDRDRVIVELERKGVSARNYFAPIHLEPFYVKMFGFKEGDFPVTERVSSATIALPFYNNLSEEEIDYVCQSLEAVIKEMKK